MAKYQGKTVKLSKPFRRVSYRGETFAGYNKPKRTPGKAKKSAVLAKKGAQVKLVRFGDPNMSIKKNIPARQRSFLARHGAILKKVKGQKSLAPVYWAIKSWRKSFKI